ncbi:MAG: ATP-dependent protease [Melioribacteraceae bacterium]|nr:MAG: ATP-dependent protease [Melioribacteraceae bacterium]
MALTKAPEYLPLSIEDLKLVCNLDDLDFENTRTVKPVDGIIGQERALKAIKLGVDIKAKGYNIFVTGLSGTGKGTTVKEMLETLAPADKPLSDYAYVNNFENEDAPTLLVFRVGDAVKFQKELSSALKFLQTNIPKVLESEQIVARKQKLVDRFNNVQIELRNKFEQKLNNENFTLGQVTVGNIPHPEVMVVIEDEAIPVNQLDELRKEEKITDKKAEELISKYTTFQNELRLMFKKTMDLKRKTEKDIISLEVESVDHLIQVTIDDLKEKFKYEKVLDFLDGLRIDILENLDLFKSGGEEKDENGEIVEIDMLKPYDVNILLDNSSVHNVPVIVETSPTFTNLFGSIEKFSDGRGGWYADFSCIKAGSLLKANGGYLVLHAGDTFSEPGVWKSLKRVLLFGKLEILDSNAGGPYSSTSMKPEPIEISTKIIMIGNSYIYSLLSSQEDDFNKIFKIKADFDYEMKRTKQSVGEYARVVKKLVEKENLLEFDQSAIAQLVELGSRYAGTKEKLTTRFAYIADLAREADFITRDNGGEIVTGFDIAEAYKLMLERHGLYETKMKEMYHRGDILIDAEGKKVGQVNGLAVYGTDKFSFGKPVRITASVSIGKGDIINVEREAGLSGNTHNKGLLIISGYFRQIFGKKIVPAFKASIVFEQGYGMIDGDSASVTEICALISAISDIPVKQSLAITGSVNQKGEIQPVGGVNEKIEGFFEVCRQKGLTGKQGVILPAQNVKDLMLSDEVIEAAREGNFSIFPISTVEEALELLTGIKAKRILKSGEFSSKTIFGVVENSLKQMHKSAAIFEKKNK